MKPKVTPPKSSPEKSDDELQTENGINGSKRHPTVMVCSDENCPLKKSPKGCGYEVAMRIRQRHISGLKKDPKKKLFPKNATPKKNNPKLRQVVLQGEVQDYRGKSNKCYYKLIGTNYLYHLKMRSQ